MVQPSLLNLSQDRIGAKFLTLIDKCFPPDHTLRKVFNRNTVKVSYRTCQSMQRTIVGHNKKLLKPQVKPADCPLGNKCLVKNVIYQATVTETTVQGTQVKENYVGLASNFKDRYKLSFNNEKYANETTLSTHIWEVKGRGSTYSIKWKVIDRGPRFNPATKTCKLCTLEKFYILFKPEMSYLNSCN